MICDMSTTIRDVAKKANVSPATVSLVLNRKPGVGKETREKVLAVVKTLGYKPGSYPSKGNASGTVRFLRIAKHGHIINRNHNVFISDYIEGMEREAQRNRYTLEVSNYSTFQPNEILDSLRQSNLEGVIILGTELDSQDIELFKIVDIPVVFIDTYHAYCPFDFVDMNNESSVYSIISHFAENGHTDIGLVKASFETRNFRLREKSFHDALSYFSLPSADGKVFTINSTYDKGYEDMSRYLQHKPHLPTALFCVCDIIAYSCMKALKEHGYNVPDDVSMAGFDNLPSSELTSPPLTSVNVSKKRIGRRAMQLLVRRLNRVEGEILPYEKVLIGSELIIRESVSSRS